MSQNAQSGVDPLDAVIKRTTSMGCLMRLYKNASLILLVLIVSGVLFSLARASVYKIRPYERGLHLRGGSFVGIDQPGWHVQIPFVDTVIAVDVIERPGEIEKLAAMTADDVTMDVSLLYTYRVLDPVRYQLEVLKPEQIVAGFVQGTLRDVVNTRKMDDVLHRRAEINQELITALRRREAQYGVEFILVQIQSASPPSEVVEAIKDKMVAEQLQEQASAEAVQQRTLADSQFYTAQKKAEGDAYLITRIAEAEAESTALNSKAQADAVRQMLEQLDGKGPLAEQYIQVLIAEALRDNSKLIISDGETMPVIDMRDSAGDTLPTTTTEP
jgi:regulator of protease activity HflC (stomatin/prohibitin superfamily)